jgi:hypothetical protein
MAHQPLPAIFGLEIGVRGEEFRNLGLDCPRQQRTRATAGLQPPGMRLRFACSGTGDRVRWRLSASP